MALPKAGPAADLQWGPESARTNHVHHGDLSLSRDISEPSERLEASKTACRTCICPMYIRLATAKAMATAKQGEDVSHAL